MTPVLSAAVGPLGEINAWREKDTDTYHFTFFNGIDYTPMSLSAEAAYYVWFFLGVLHPACCEDDGDQTADHSNECCFPNCGDCEEGHAVHDERDTAFWDKVFSEDPADKVKKAPAKKKPATKKKVAIKPNKKVGGKKK